MNANPLADGLLDRLRDAVGEKHVLSDATDLAPYLVEERGLYQGTAGVVVRPADVQQVAAAVKACAEAGVSIVPQGGNTGLCGGAVAEGGQVILSLGRLNAIRAVDAANHTITVEAGVILHQLQQAADDAGCLFPLSLAAEGTCQIGGNIATNAGGTAVLRYGNTRDLVLGLEVVLADGTVWNGLRALRKDNTGYDLKHLFIGGEGTLGIITAAVLKMFPKPKARETALVALPDLAAAGKLFDRARAGLSDSLTGFELVPGIGMDFVTKHIPGMSLPFEAPHPWYALLELTSPRESQGLAEALEEILGAAFEAEEVSDAVIAASESQRNELWALRESLPEAQKHEGGSIKHDVAVPVSRVVEFIERGMALVEAHIDGIRPCPFGHMGDGNIHFNLTQPVGADKAAYLARWEEVNRIVHDLVTEMGGSISAEHGVGCLKVDEITHYKSAVEIDMMRKIKQAFDPGNILNPGKVVRTP